MTEDEFKRVFSALYPDIFEYAARRTDPSTAEEVTAEALLVVWKRWPTAPSTPAEVQSLRAWTLGVARGFLSNAQRSKFRAEKLEASLKAAIFAGVPVVEPDHAPVVEEQRAAVGVFRKLSPREQEFLEMVAWEGLSVEEIATALDLSTTAVAMRLMRARRRLSALMRASGLEAGGDFLPQQPRPAGTTPGEGSP